MKPDFELFQADGHLTDAGLGALAENALEGELHRLEAAEHLGFCDACLLRYTALLADDALAEPEKPLWPKVQAGLRRRKLRVSFGRYATVAAAACLAVVMWGVGSGFFAGMASGQGAGGKDAPATTAAEPQPGFSQRISQGLDSFSAGLNRFFGSLSPSGADAAAQKDADEAKTQEDRNTGSARDARIRRQRERLFDDKQSATAPPEPDSAPDAGQDAA